MLDYLENPASQPQEEVDCPVHSVRHYDLRTSEKLTDGVEINCLIKKLTGKLIMHQEHFGISPFCVTTPPAAVNS